MDLLYINPWTGKSSDHCIFFPKAKLMDYTDYVIDRYPIDKQRRKQAKKFSPLTWKLIFISLWQFIIIN